MRVGFIAALAHISLVVLYPLLPDVLWVLVTMSAVIFTTVMCFGMAPAAIQQMMPNRMRGQAASLYLFWVNLIGLGLGPSALAWMTDYVYQDTQQVGMSLLGTGAVTSVLATVLLYMGMQHFRSSMAQLRDWEAGIEIRNYSMRTMTSVMSTLFVGILGSVWWLIFG